ncbi:cyclase family protein [Arthrobacter yangruifuii]|uniref:Cyclase family protein n=1 Tax=Arthrobacter yangruifuii TaxID=2606616 RepID=A0A5N6MHB6_9MICC|nr:cyclase family protein [Arthrobacter yangruifuii]KAD3633139.1 cyclase family protein [Arthrobacter yangruifuii]
MQVVDLSHPVRCGMQVFPGDPSVTLRSAATVAADGFAVAELHLGSHSGTHLDAPLHTVEGGGSVDTMVLETLMGPARIVAVPGAAANAVVRWTEVGGQLEGLQPGTIVLFCTGWSRHFGTPAYLQHPTLDAGIAEQLVAAGVRLVGVDTLNPDPTPGPAQPGQTPGGTALPFHDAFLGAGGGIVENLTNLEKVVWPEPRFSALPLKLEGLDGSPVRAVAWRP